MTKKMTHGFVVLFFGLSLPVYSAIQYGVVDLGTLGGGSSKAFCINDGGQIVGWSLDSAGYQMATLFDSTGGGRNINLGTLGGTVDRFTSSALSINDDGQIVGWAEGIEIGPGPYYIQNQVLRAVSFDSSGGGQNVNLKGVGSGSGGESWGSAVNNNGQIVGWGAYGLLNKAASFDPSGGGSNLRLEHGSGNNSRAYSINDSGQIVGWVQGGTNRNSRAAMFDTGGADDKIIYLSSHGSYAYCINNHNQIVGQDNGSAAIFDSLGGKANVNLGSLGSSESQANCINDLGQIIGWTSDSSYRRRAAWFDASGGGNNVDLNSLIDPSSGWFLAEATWINDRGQIVGYGQMGDQTHAFLLNPLGENSVVPEPGMVFLLMAGVPAIFCRRRS